MKRSIAHRDAVTIPPQLGTPQPDDLAAAAIWARPPPPVDPGDEQAPQTVRPFRPGDHVTPRRACWLALRWVDIPHAGRVVHPGELLEVMEPRPDGQIEVAYRQHRWLVPYQELELRQSIQSPPPHYPHRRFRLTRGGRWRATPRARNVARVCIVVAAVLGAWWFHFRSGVAPAPPARQQVSQGDTERIPTAALPSVAANVPRAMPPLIASAGATVEPLAHQWLVTALAVGCYQEPSNTTIIAAHFAPGTVQSMDAQLDLPDGTWQRTAEAGCWIRTSPGPVVLVDTPARAVCVAAGFRQPPPLVADCVSIVAFQDATPSGQATLRAQAPPGAQCTGNALIITGSAMEMQELLLLSADDAGLVNWSWKVRPRARSETLTVTVTCTPGGTTSVSVPAA